MSRRILTPLQTVRE